MRWLIFAFLMITNQALAADENPLRVSLVTLSGSEGTSMPTTGAPAFVPTEGEPCVLQVTLENRGELPIAISTITVSSTGVVEPNRRFALLSFNDDRVTAEAQERAGDKINLTFRYDARAGDAPIAGRLAGLVGGGEQTPYHWATPDGVIMPGKAISKNFPFVPVAPDGSLTIPVSAKVLYLKIGRAAGEGVLFPEPGARIPPRPEWTREHPDSAGMNGVPQEPPFTVTFAPRKNWDGQVSFVDALIARDLPGEGTLATGSNRIVLRPLDRPLKALIPQLQFRPQSVAYSPALKAWFLAVGDRTTVVQGSKRFDIRQDVTDFITSRVFHGNDAAPWKVVLDRDAKEFGVYLKGLPRERARGSDYDTVSIPLDQFLDRLADADRAGLRVAINGDLFIKRE